MEIPVKYATIDKSVQLNFPFLNDVILQCYNRAQIKYFKSVYETMPGTKPPYTRYLQMAIVSELAEKFNAENYAKYFHD